MIRRFKMWLYETFLPRETKEMYLKDIRSLIEANKSQKGEIERLKAYIEGMHRGMRSRVIVKNEVIKGD